MANIFVPEKLQFLFKPKRLKIAFGGRGGAKTVSFSKALLFLGYKQKKRIMCLREFQSSIDDSVHDGLVDEIDKLGMGHHYKVTRKQIAGKNGTRFRYAGLTARTRNSIKSKHNFDIAWVEESETISDKSLSVLIPTIRKPGSELWFSFNPEDEESPMWELVKPYIAEIKHKGFYEDEDRYIVQINLPENPFATQELLKESADLKKKDYKRWLWIWGGEPYADYRESIIQPEWFEAAVDAHIKLKFPAQGIKVASFDPADTGKDSKALLFRHGSVITHAEVWGDGELPEAIDYAFQKAYDWRADQFVYDATGLGRGVKVGLGTRLDGKSMEAIPYEGGGSVDFPDDIYADHRSNKDTFKNKRAQYHWWLRDRFEATYNAIEKGIYTNPDDLISVSSEISCLPLLKNEAIKVRRQLRNVSYIQVMEKAEMLRKYGIKSPNVFDALVMSFGNKTPETKYRPWKFTSEF